MITQKYKLNIIPSFNGPVIVKCSQYDKGSRSIEFSLFDGANPFVLDSNYAITVRGTKKDGTAFEYNCSIEDDKVVFLLNQQMTLFDGKYPCELRIINDAEILGSSNFTLFVEKSPIDENTIISESDLPAYEQLLNDLQGEKISNWLEENITQETGYVLDSSLTVQGAAADAKAVGNALTILEGKIDDGSSDTGLTDEIAQALLACFQNVAWINADGQNYYNALEEALQNAAGIQYTVTNLLTECTNSNSNIKATEGKKYIAVLTANSGYTLSTVTVTMGGIDVTGTYYSGGTISIPNVTGDIVITAVATSFVSSITAAFTQGSAVIYNTDSLDTLKQYLVVTANYSDGSSETVTDYTLSGTLTVGTSTITVNYGGKTTTFNVTVTQYPYVFVEYIENPGDANSWIELDVVPSSTFGFKGVFSLAERTGDVFVFGTREITDGKIILGVVSDNKKPYLGWGKYTSGSGRTPVIEWGTPFTAELNYENDRGVYLNGTDVWGTTFPDLEFTPTWNYIVLGYRSTSAISGRQCRIYSLEITEGANISMILHPCYRVSDGAIGLYDSVNDVFYGNSGTGTLVKGADLNG